MNIFVPKGSKFYHVQFRVRDVTRATGWRQVLRSCGTDNYEAAKIRAADIFVEEAARGRKPALLETAPKVDAIANPSTGTDPAIVEIFDLHERWMASCRPGEKRPSPSTARDYRRRLQQLCRMLKVNTVSELSAAVEGLTAHKLGVSEGNFVPLLRTAAGVFRRATMEYFRKQGLCFEAPLKSGPPIRPKEFDAPPSPAQLASLILAAKTDLKPHFTREYLAFLLCLNAGLRAQEAAHVRWCDINSTGIFVRAEAGYCSALPERERYSPKSGSNRHIPVDPEILAELETFRGLPKNFVVHSLKKPRVAGYIPKIRAQCVFRFLAKWIRKKLAELIPDYKNPAHWLRKVFGSVVAKEAGIATAGEYLGHAKGSPVTAQTYVALLARPAFRIGMTLPHRAIEVGL